MQELPLLHGPHDAAELMFSEDQTLGRRVENPLHQQSTHRVPVTPPIPDDAVQQQATQGVPDLLPYSNATVQQQPWSAPPGSVQQQQWVAPPGPFQQQTWELPPGSPFQQQRAFSFSTSPLNTVPEGSEKADFYDSRTCTHGKNGGALFGCQKCAIVHSKLRRSESRRKSINFPVQQNQAVGHLGAVRW